jgi:hypothetical protein
LVATSSLGLIDADIRGNGPERLLLGTGLAHLLTLLGTSAARPDVGQSNRGGSESQDNGSELHFDWFEMNEWFVKESF